MILHNLEINCVVRILTNFYLLESAHRIGRLAALLLKQCPLISELRLHDNHNSICVVAEDLSHIDTKTKIKSYCGLSVLKNAVMVRKLNAFFELL